jgi:hypothetical protein
MERDTTILEAGTGDSRNQSSDNDDILSIRTYTLHVINNIETIFLSTHEQTNTYLIIVTSQKLLLSYTTHERMFSSRVTQGYSK